MLIALRVTSVVHALAYALQPILAGMFLSGRDNAIGSHGDNAAIVSTIARVLTVMAAIFVLEIVQLTAGTKHIMWLHIPLGVGLFAAVIATLPLVFAARPAEEART